MPFANQLPECLGIIFNCSDPDPQCRTLNGFNFNTLWAVTQQYQEQCPSGPWLFRQLGAVGDVSEHEAALTNRICEAIAGAEWKKYSNADIWYRLTTWKFPLFQLVFNSPRPPLGFWDEAFTIVHFLGDPIGTSTDLVRKFDSCQSRAEYWTYKMNDHNISAKMQDPDGDNHLYHQQVVEALALIAVSYDEWGLEQGTAVEQYLTHELDDLCADGASPDDRHHFIRLCLRTAKLLAADRSTKFLPVIIAQSFFIGTVVISIVRTKSLAEGPNPQTYIDIETYSIGFTALFFWVISTVTQTSIIGSSQTANAIPEILQGFRQNLRHAFPHRLVRLPEDFDATTRYHSGGIYSWLPRGATKEFFESAAVRVQRLLQPKLPDGRRSSSVKKTFHHSWPWFCTILPLLSVSFGTVIGMFLTTIVPPDGWSCRSSAEVTIFATWLASYACDLIPWGRHHRCRFWFTFAKDFLAMAATLGLIVATQIGIFNKCSCYTLNGWVGLALPQMPRVRETLEHRLNSHYMALTVTGIVAQLLVFPGIIITRYFGAVRVFLQRDDGQSDLQWCSDFAALLRSLARSMRFRRSGSTRQSAGIAEEGPELGTIARVDGGTTQPRQGQSERAKRDGTTSHVEEVVDGNHRGA